LCAFEGLNYIYIFIFKIFESKPEGIRKGRPGSRWLENVEKDLWQIKVTRRRRKAVDREERASVTKRSGLSEGRRDKE
jgi:hypothetical protein